jgi:hypothetical protein
VWVDTPDGCAGHRSSDEAKAAAEKAAAEKAASDALKKEQDEAVTTNSTCLLGIGCKMDVYKMLGIRPGGEEGKSESRTSVLTCVLDAVLGITMFIGTIVSLAFSLCGLLFIFSAVDSGQKQKAKTGMINAIIGMILVAGSYAIIRLIQYVAKG